MLMLRPRAILQSLFEAAIAAADPAQDLHPNVSVIC
jgi:glycerate-2-kinase